MVGILLAASFNAHAQGVNAGTDNNLAPPPNLQLPGTGAQWRSEQQNATPADRGCEQLDLLRYPGRENVVFPSVCDSLFSGAQYKRTLADYGILLNFEIRQSFGYDLLGHNTPNPIYNGQNPTDNIGIFLEMVYDLSRIGLPAGSRLAVGPELYRDNYTVTGPNAFVFNELAAFVPLAHDTVEVQAGYMLWQNVFYGSNLGTSSASSALGPQSSLQTELGMATFTSTPGIDVRVWAPGHRFYNHFGVERSASPGGGYLYDSARGPGVEWVVPGTGGLFIDEIGYRIPRGPDRHYLWLRGGAIYNNTGFSNFDDKVRTVRGNNGFYFTGDYQITHPDRKLFARGVYVNFKVDAAPPDRNLYADDASISLYDIGPFDARPRDAASIGVTYNHFSEDAVDRYRTLAKGYTPNYSFTAIGSYNLHLYKGLFLVNSLSWVRHPTARENLPNALVGMDALTMLF